MFVILAAGLLVSQSFAEDEGAGLPKGLKIGIVLVACAVGYGVYKWVTKSKPADGQTVSKEIKEYKKRPQDLKPSQKEQSHKCDRSIERPFEDGFWIPG